jgi:DNA invertase Pin-like site-specific DNA recombinase
VEAPRLFVIEQLDRHRRIEFSPRPVAAPAPETKVRGRTRGRGAKLDPEKVRAIRAAWAAGESVADIAGRFNVSKTTVEHIRTRRSWADVR